MFFDSTFLLLIPVIILTIYVQVKVKNIFNKYYKIDAQNKISASELVRKIVNWYKLENISVKQIKGILSDNYDIRTRTINLSSGVYNSCSLSALGIAAHEAGHAIQHKQAYFPLNIRNSFFPLANLGSNLALPLFFIGFFFLRNQFLMNMGIFFYLGVVLFSLITLPIEFNASRRAIKILKKGAILSEQELIGARRVLSAAALTYVASTTMAVMQLIRMLILRNSRE